MWCGLASSFWPKGSATGRSKLEFFVDRTKIVKRDIGIPFIKG
jgi:hypothetical protein